ncbi:MAG: ASKHA domain-containing protein [Planctomycetota bacterium]
MGADTTAVALATDIDSAEQITLAVDIGTNGELVLAANGKLYAASCAAGPAFEGARIRCGSRAVEGAIQGVIVNSGDIDLDVIGDCPPRSICGSGLIDAVAVMLDLGIIDKSGRFADPGTLGERLPPAIASRISKKGGEASFELAAVQERVVLTQADIRQVQLAKGAIRAGIRLLLQRVGLEDTEIKRILLAGAFGNYIRRESALRMGLLPDVPAERIHFVGNAACSGAEMILVSSNCRDMARELARKIEYIEIAHEREFESVFAEAMRF